MTNTINRPTDKQLDAIKLMANAILEAITAAGSAGVPSGHLYAMLMGRMSLDTYNKFIDALTRAGKITNHGHLLKCQGTKAV